ncbi:MAG TPA: HDIG domain-containing protein [Acidimicrobiia bacterium]|nr:HDIG domain-containing protein [Acidimicrobiia bacterium]
MPRPTLMRIAIFVVVVAATWGVLSLGTSVSDPNLEVGALASQDYRARQAADVEDTIATAALEEDARNRVDAVRDTNIEIENLVRDQINSLFDDVAALAVADDPETTPTTLPEPTSTTAAEGTEPVEPVVLSGVVFLDVDGDGVFQPSLEVARPDRGLERVTVQVPVGDEVASVVTGPDGSWSIEVTPGSVLVGVDDGDAQIPHGFIVGTDNLNQLVECESGQECNAAPIGFKVNLRPIEDVTAQIITDHPVPADAVSVLAATAADDVIRAALGEPLHLDPVIRTATLQRVNELFGVRVTPDDLPDFRARQTSNPPLVFYTDTNPPAQDMVASEAAGEVVASFLQANFLIDPERTEAAKAAAADLVEPVVVSYTPEQIIVNEREALTQLDIDAIADTSSLSPAGQDQGGLLAVIAVLIGMLGLYLARFRAEFWSRPRMIALLGILIVLAAGAVRATTLIQEATSWYVLPAVAFGFVTAVLFDARIGALMALSVGVLTAVGTGDIGITVFAILATLAPIPFVSSVSSRGAFRNAVVFSALTAAVVAAATSWFFHLGPDASAPKVIGLSVAWAFGVSAMASLIGLAGLQFFESAFDITTTLSLLDLTDRNHKGLQLLQEQAFGTFNHSLMVGTLADAAARAIGANALLAMAMAYYHDLGKTQNPTYYIENQFGIPNPHDLLTPEESAEMIRRHVTDGIVLARQFKIPSDVATGIVSHHGDGIMRFFYEKARSQRGDAVNPDDFRHIGHKPKTAESAIVMLADSLEAACRAVFQTEEPTPEAIEKVVNRVIDEKLDDGQLQESPLTQFEMTQVRKAFFESLVGHYHQRIAYPNFPGT